MRHRPPNRTHLIFALADHFEPAIVPEDGRARAPYSEQERRLERWCREYPNRFGSYRDAEGRPFVHTYFYPAEQYDQLLVARLAEHCRAGWGEIEIHLHHGVEAPDTAENTRRELIEFRDRLAQKHDCLSYRGESPQPRYGFVHGNFALANSNHGRGCGVDSEMQILADTGCYADFTLPAGAFHRAQTSKINSIYECGRPLVNRAPHRKGVDLARGRTPQVLPLVVQGPLMLDFGGRSGSRRLHIDNAALTGSNPASLHRLSLWKRAAISVEGRPDWLFIKLHTHGMDPRHEEATLGSAMQKFVRELAGGAEERNEILHFVSAREMVNIILAACDGKDGNPGEHRDYQFKRERPLASDARQREESAF
ncbi:MAG TPA: hypothetical protein VN310_04650 [Candidatus Dormibacteraeota bacterium]|nr:hypothetical protein [Candidatus Dormibacteraeota bacterium]